MKKALNWRIYGVDKSTIFIIYKCLGFANRTDVAGFRVPCVGGGRA